MANVPEVGFDVRGVLLLLLLLLLGGGGGRSRALMIATTTTTTTTATTTRRRILLTTSHSSSRSSCATFDECDVVAARIVGRIVVAFVNRRCTRMVESDDRNSG
jgi:hypothetical protein